MLDVVVVTYNSAAVLKDLLDSLQVALAPISSVRVIVADNASSDSSAAIARHHPIGAFVVPVGYNAGYSAGINIAVSRFGRNCALLLLNADIRLHPDCITAMLAALQGPRVGVVVPRTLHDDGTLSHSIRREPSLLTAWSEALLGGRLAGLLGLGEIVMDKTAYETNQDIALASGAILMVSAAARERIGDWDERYFLYSEEVDYQRRAREAGFTIRLVTDAVCAHIGGESNSDPGLFSLLTTNRARYYRRYHGPVATAFFRLAILVGEGIRFALGPTHRAAFIAALTQGEERARQSILRRQAGPQAKS